MYTVRMDKKGGEGGEEEGRGGRREEEEETENIQRESKEQNKGLKKSEGCKQGCFLSLPREHTTLIMENKLSPSFSDLVKAPCVSGT